MTAVAISCGRDAPPIVRLVAGALRRAAGRRSSAWIIRCMRGICVLESEKDSQHLSITFAKGAVHVKSGISKPAKLHITINWGKYAEPDYKPQMKGAWLHPLFTLGLLRLLAPSASGWEEAAERFWAVASKVPFTPSKLEVNCPSQSRRLTFGEGETAVLVEGEATQLNRLFNGEVLLLDAMMNSKLKARGTLQHLSGLSGVGVSLLMGKADKQAPKKEKEKGDESGE